MDGDLGREAVAIESGNNRFVGEESERGRTESRGGGGSVGRGGETSGRVLV